MDNLGLIILAVVFWFLFHGPHLKSGEKKGDKGGKK
jgi:hypothetical protein